MTPAPQHPDNVIRLPLYVDEPHPCPYLPGRVATDQFTIFDSLEPQVYESLMNAGFRRSGRIGYRAACEGCRECTPIRVPVERFRPSRSQRRVWRRNHDVRIEIGPAKCTDEKWRIYQAYLAHQHDGKMAGEREQFEQFLYTAPGETIEMS